MIIVNKTAYTREEDALIYKGLFTSSVHELIISNTQGEMITGVLRLKIFFFLHKLIVCFASLSLLVLFVFRFFLSFDPTSLIAIPICFGLLIFYYYFEKFDIASHWSGWKEID